MVGTIGDRLGTILGGHHRHIGQGTTGDHHGRWVGTRGGVHHGHGAGDLHGVGVDPVGDPDGVLHGAAAHGMPATIRHVVASQQEYATDIRALDLRIPDRLSTLPTVVGRAIR